MSLGRCLAFVLPILLASVHAQADITQLSTGYSTSSYETVETVTLHKTTLVPIIYTTTIVGADGSTITSIGTSTEIESTPPPTTTQLPATTTSLGGIVLSTETSTITSSICSDTAIPSCMTVYTATNVVTLTSTIEYLTSLMTTVICPTGASSAAGSCITSVISDTVTYTSIIPVQTSTATISSTQIVTVINTSTIDGTTFMLPSDTMTVSPSSTTELQASPTPSQSSDTTETSTQETMISSTTLSTAAVSTLESSTDVSSPPSSTTLTSMDSLPTNTPSSTDITTIASTETVSPLPVSTQSADGVTSSTQQTLQASTTLLSSVSSADSATSSTQQTSQASTTLLTSTTASSVSSVGLPGAVTSLAPVTTRICMTDYVVKSMSTDKLELTMSAGMSLTFGTEIYALPTGTETFIVHQLHNSKAHTPLATETVAQKKKLRRNFVF